jgi:ATP-dependent helicase HrpB
MRERLPVDGLLAELRASLRGSQSLVLVAPPGAGKTTRVPPALLEPGITEGQILVLQPRRLAARAVARRMAAELGEPVGERVGYQVRFEERRSARTRILVLTEGILTRRLVADPLLEGVGCVILDELHERSVDTDLCLAFLRETLEARPELRLIAMSATLDAERVASYLGGCPVLRCEVRGHPLAIEHLTRDRRPLGAQVRSACVSLLADERPGDLLVFLPGAPEIERTLAELRGSPLRGDPLLVPLHGSLSSEEQDRALQRDPAGRRRIVLATNIAETSLTVPGVTAVVDSGLCKRLRYDPGLGLDRLELGHVSRSSAEQRAGRAGREGPGRVLRLWSAADELGLARSETPELLRVDLAPVLLAVLAFRPGDPRRFPFLDPPPEARIRAALTLLDALDLVTSSDPGEEPRLSERGRALAALPLHPRLGAILLAAARTGLLAEGALIAALLAGREILERPRAAALPTHASDLLERRELFLELEAARFTRDAHRQLGLDPRATREVARVRDQLLTLGRAHARASEPLFGSFEERLRRLPLAGFPDRLCRRRTPNLPDATMVGGRGVRLEESSGVREAELFLALVAEAGRPGLHSVSNVRLASAVELADLEALWPERLRIERGARFDAARGLVVGSERLLFADLVLSDRDGVPVDPVRASLLLAAAAAERFAELFHPEPRARQLQARLRLAARVLPEESWPDASEDGLRALLPEICQGRRGLDEIAGFDWASLLAGRLGRRQLALLDRELPERIAVPSGNQIRIDYAAALGPEGAPLLAVKLQELFGLRASPRIARGQIALLVQLLAPSGRPVQVTRDLESFWRTGYAEVRRDLRGRYPRHPWPEDPLTAVPTARAKPRR